MLFFSTFKLHIFANTGWGRSRLTDVSLQNAGFILFFFNSYRRTFFDCLQREKKGEKGEGEREREMEEERDREREKY